MNPGNDPLVGGASPLRWRMGSFTQARNLRKAFGVSRSAIWKAVRSLRDLGATLHAVRNRGYRLTTASEPLAAGGDS